MNNMDRDLHRYDDIIDMPHPTSEKHPRMSIENRAAQFAPFAALNGFEDAIWRTGIEKEKQVENEIIHGDFSDIC